MGYSIMTAAAAVVGWVLVIAGSARSQTSQVIKGKPQPVAVTTAPVAPGVFMQTPTFIQVPRRRELAEELFEGLLDGRHGRSLAAYIPPPGVPKFGPTVHLGTSLLAEIGAFAVNGTATGGGTGSPPLLTFIGEISRDIVSGRVTASFLFDSSTVSFLSGFAQSGADAASSFQFLRTLLILPEDQVYSAEGAPPFAESESSFMASDPSRPVIVRLQTQRPSDYAPNIALRFDYAQTGVDARGSAVTPYVSVYFTDLDADYPAGLPGTSPSFGSPQINLIQSFSFFPTPLEEGFLTGQA